MPLLSHTGPSVRGRDPRGYGGIWVTTV